MASLKKMSGNRHKLKKEGETKSLGEGDYIHTYVRMM